MASVNGYLQMANGSYLLKPDGGKIIINVTEIETDLVTLVTRLRDATLSLSTRDESLNLKDRDNTLTGNSRDTSKNTKPRDNTLTLRDNRD